MTDTDLTEKVARAICREDHPCWSIVSEIMEAPSYAPGREGDAQARTQAGRYRDLARAAIAQAELDAAVEVEREKLVRSLESRAERAFLRFRQTGHSVDRIEARVWRQAASLVRSSERRGK